MLIRTSWQLVQRLGPPVDVEHAFLREIEAVPDQDDTRLVFADWLEEQGSPRAEFIRLQCVQGDVSVDRDGRIRELLEDHREDWLAPVRGCLGPGLAERIEDIRFVRGFPAEVTLPASDFVDHAARLFEAIPLLDSVCLTDVRAALTRLAGSVWLARLKELRLAGNGLGNGGAQALAESRHLGRLAALHLRQNGIGSPGIAALVRSGLPELRVLNLSGNVLGDGGLQALALWSRLEQLVELDLADNHISDAETGDFLDRLSRRTLCLQRLNLRSNGLRVEAAQALRRAAGSLRHLFGLDLSGNTLGSDGAQALADVRMDHVRDLNLADTHLDVEAVPTLVRAFPRLDTLSLANNPRLGDAGVFALVELGLPRRALDLSGTGVGDGGLIALASAPQMKGLERLDLRNTSVGPEGVHALLTQQGEWRLRSLALSGANFGAAGTAALAQCPRLAQISELRLEGTNIGLSGARRLAESAYLKGLQRLHLAWANLGNGGFRALANAEPLSQLRTLSAVRCRLGDEGIEALSNAAKLRNLVALDLSHNEIGDQGVRAIVQSPHFSRLTELNLTGNPCSDGAAEALLTSPSLTRLVRLSLSAGAIGPRLQEALSRRFGGRLNLVVERHHL